MSVRQNPLGPNGGRPQPAAPTVDESLPVAADADAWLYRGFSGIVSLMHKRCVYAKGKRLPAQCIQAVEGLITMIEALLSQAEGWEKGNGTEDQFDQMSAKAFDSLAFLIAQRKDCGINLNSPQFSMLRSELGRLRELALGMKKVNERIDNGKP